MAALYKEFINEVDSGHYTHREKIVAMPLPEWITPNQAAEREDCPVTGETLRRMIKSNRVPKGHWMKIPFGKRFSFLIDANILSELDYRNTGQRGKGISKN